MRTPTALSTFAALLIAVASSGLRAQAITGELKRWHAVTLTFDGPAADEAAAAPDNPALDYRLDVTFANGATSYTVPGYFAADGDAGNTGATTGDKWRVHFAPDATGTWTYVASFRAGIDVAVGAPGDGVAVAPIDGASGSFSVSETDKSAPDNRARGRLEYVGQHYLRYAGTGEYFLKAGADSPENFLAYDDFDDTPNNRDARKSWGPHVQDWRPGDPTWGGGTKGKGIIGAVNYLADEGQNVFSFLTMSHRGDDRNVFPWPGPEIDDFEHVDCSKLDQWEIVFAHADARGMYLHFKTQETENDQLLDGGELGRERKLYYRTLIARFGHHLALNWNLGEENTNTDAQRIGFADFFAEHDPYRHHVVLHTYPNAYDQVYTPLLGGLSELSGVSIQTGYNIVHRNTAQWRANSAAAGRPWVIANDEQNGANIGVPHDDYTGNPTQSDIRKVTLWGNFMAGGGGVEYYFGYSLPENDIQCQDFRSRSNMWRYNRHALSFFRNHTRFWTLAPHDELVGNTSTLSGAVSASNARYCFADPGEEYVVYLPSGGTHDLQLEGGDYEVRWFDPRNGGLLQTGTTATVTGPGLVSLGAPPADVGEDWAALVTRVRPPLPIALASFTAAARGADVALAWETTAEADADRFEVERSGDGATFRSIAAVDARGTGGSGARYAYDDLGVGGPVVYYRLRLVDRDGGSALSRTVAVDLDVSPVLEVRPRGDGRYDGLLAGVGPGSQVSVTVADVSGRALATRTEITSGDPIEIDLSAYPAGVYAVTVVLDGMPWRGRLLRR